MAMTLRLRQFILRRDRFSCRLCGRTANDGVKLEVDHRKPLSVGGTDKINNLWTLCDACNRGKGDKWDDTGHRNTTDVCAFVFDPQDLEFVALTILDSDLRAHLRSAFFFYDLLDIPSTGKYDDYPLFGLVLGLVADDAVVTLRLYEDSAYALYKQSMQVASAISVGSYSKKRKVIEVEVRETLLRATKDYVDGRWGTAFTEPDLLNEHKEYMRTFVPRSPLTESEFSEVFDEVSGDLDFDDRPSPGGMVRE